jgi:hypothetical protein
MFDISTLDPKKVTAEPIVGPGSIFEKFDTIRLEKIYVPPMSDNPVRKKGKNLTNIEKLAQSLSRSIHYDKMPPIVLKRSKIVDGKHYEYELICGNHRLAAFLKNGFDQWIFAIYKVAQNGYSFEDSVRTLQLIENDHDPALESSDEDISNTVARLINKGSTLVQNNEDSIREYVETYCKNKCWQTKAKIVRQAVRLSGAYQDVVTYTADDAFAWIADNTDYSVAGNYDAKRKKYGWTVLETYEYEYVMNAIRKFAETGRESYFICHTKAPTEKRNLSTRRKDIVEEFDYLSNCLIEVFKFYEKNGRFPWGSEGYLPQDHKAKEEKFIPLT